MKSQWTMTQPICQISHKQRFCDARLHMKLTAGLNAGGCCILMTKLMAHLLHDDEVIAPVPLPHGMLHEKDQVALVLGI